MKKYRVVHEIIHGIENYIEAKNAPEAMSKAMEITGEEIEKAVKIKDSDAQDLILVQAVDDPDDCLDCDDWMNSLK